MSLLGSLPDEMLLEISQLLLLQTQVSIGGTCHSFNNFIKEKSLWKKNSNLEVLRDYLKKYCKQILTHLTILEFLS
ncbi:MAG: F-box-like domain-containing protein [Proteobacteria bacterium]|nr:F-box-like domain-containing protein [Pseudomonadota bacterium]